MPLVLPPSVAGVHETNITAAARAGTTVTASATANQKGSYTSLIDPTDFPSYGIWIAFRDVQVAAAIQNMLVDISYGPTGGGSEQIVIPDLNASNAPDGTTYVGACFYHFPVYIPAGVRVSARCQASTASDTVLVAIWLDQNPLYGNPGGRVSVYGRVAASSRGTAVTPGAGAFGTWTELLNEAAGSGLTRPHKYWVMSMDPNVDTTLTDDQYVLVELGIGPNNTNVTRLGQFRFQEEGNEGIVGPEPMIIYAPATVDSTNLKLWARSAAAATGDIRGFMAWGID